MKKILLISNNPLSQMRNNGKTLYSFFREYSQELLGQIYIENSFPDFESDIKFYRITDKENLASFFKKDVECGSIVTPKVDVNSIMPSENNNRLKNGSTIRLVREGVWLKKRWKNDKFNAWLDEFCPDVVFLYAGDSIFMYDMAEYIVKRFGCEFGIYISDDYILPRSNKSITDMIRRKLIRRAMDKAVRACDYFFTISEDMRIIYKEMFGKDSTCIMNIPRTTLKEFSETQNEQVEFIYCGGLEYGREETLILLANKINEFNTNNIEKKGFLSVYSLQTPTEETMQRLNESGVAAFKGRLTKEQVDEAIHNSDVVVHVESFDKKNMECTKLSISTKISEYLCCGKPILAIGPKGIASMNYIADVACCVTDIDSLDIAVKNIVMDERYRKELVDKSAEYFLKINKKMNPLLVIDILTGSNEIEC